MHTTALLPIHYTTLSCVTVTEELKGHMTLFDSEKYTTKMLQKEAAFDTAVEQVYKRFEASPRFPSWVRPALLQQARLFRQILMRDVEEWSRAWTSLSVGEFWEKVHKLNEKLRYKYILTA